MKRFLLLLIALATPPWFSQPAAQEKPRYGGTLNVGIHSDLYGLNPFVRMRSIDRTVRSLVYETHRFFGVHPNVRGFASDDNENLDTAAGGLFRVWLSR